MAGSCIAGMLRQAQDQGGPYLSSWQLEAHVIEELEHFILGTMKHNVPCSFEKRLTSDVHAAGLNTCLDRPFSGNKSV